MPQEQLVKLQCVWGQGIQSAAGLERKHVFFSLKHSGLGQCSGNLPNLSLGKKWVLCRLQRELMKFFLDGKIRSVVPQFPQVDYAGIVCTVVFGTGPGQGRSPFLSRTGGEAQGGLWYSVLPQCLRVSCGSGVLLGGYLFPTCTLSALGHSQQVSMVVSTAQRLEE